jgi:hypothetical protein
MHLYITVLHIPLATGAFTSFDGDGGHSPLSE